MGDVVKIEGSAAKARHDHNQMMVLRVKGVSAQTGTPETDADPRNPNAKRTPMKSDKETEDEIRGWVESYGLHRNWVIGGQRCCSPDELDAAIAHEIKQRREHNSTSMIVTTGHAACAPGVFLPPAPGQ